MVIFEGCKSLPITGFYFAQFPLLTLGKKEKTSDKKTNKAIIDIRLHHWYATHNEYLLVFIIQ